jgi:putative FmdB family regulatory protein
MPLYEYQCDACGRRFERIQKFSDPPVDVCPTCGGSVRKLLSSPAIQFKGSGWYITDYAKSGEAKKGEDTKTADKKPETPAAESGGKAESTASPKESKPAPASPPASTDKN